MTRDPKVTPKAGDVLMVNGNRVEVIGSGAGVVTIQSRNRVQFITLAVWQYWVKDSPCLVNADLEAK